MFSAQFELSFVGAYGGIGLPLFVCLCIHMHSFAKVRNIRKPHPQKPLLKHVQLQHKTSDDVSGPKL